MAAKTGWPFRYDIGGGAAVMEGGVEAPVPTPPKIGPSVIKGPKADLPEPEATMAKGLREGGKIPAATDPPLTSGASTEPLGAMMPMVLVPDAVPDAKISDCPESVAVFRAGFVEVAVPVPSSVRVPCLG